MSQHELRIKLQCVYEMFEDIGYDSLSSYIDTGVKNTNHVDIIALKIALLQERYITFLEKKLEEIK